MVLLVGGALAPAAADGPLDSDERHRPSYWRDVEPMFARHCTSCHSPDGAGPFALETYDEVRRRARTILEAITSGFMPPWLPLHGYGTFVGAREISADEIETFRSWVEGGRREGERFGRPTAAPVSFPRPPRRADLVASMEPYTLRADGTDEFRSFPLSAGLEGGRWVEGVEFRIPDKRLVHHATLRIDTGATARSLDRRDGRPGFPGTDFLGDMPDGQIVGWTPGRHSIAGDPEIPWQLPSGADLVLELHMLPSGKPERIQVEVALFFTDTPPKKKPYLLHLAGGIDLDIPAGEPDYLVVDTYELPVEVEALAIYPHAHYLATGVECFARRPDGTIEWLLRIREWDFNWQDLYRFSEPVTLPRGTTVSVRISYDNSEANPRNPHRPPRRVRFGPLSSDEMADVYIQVLPKQDSDLGALARHHRRKEDLTEIAGWRSRLAAEPADAVGHNALGRLLARGGRLDEAADHFGRALQLQPDFTDAIYNLGVYETQRNRPDRAIDLYESLLALAPEHAEGAANLGVLLLERGAHAAAISRLEAAVGAKPGLSPAHYFLGLAYGVSGRIGDAQRSLRTAVTQRPDWGEAHNQLGVALARGGRMGEALAAFQRAVALDPGNLDARRNLANARTQARSDR